MNPLCRFRNADEGACRNLSRLGARPLSEVFAPLERRATSRPLRAVAIGAGREIPRRLAGRGWQTAAVDLPGGDEQGVGADGDARGESDAPLIQANLERLPFADAQVDVVLYVDCFHFAEDYWEALGEARRCLRWGGQVVICGTPVYSHWRFGEADRDRRIEAGFHHGRRPGETLLSMGYLDETMLDRLQRELNIRWRVSKPRKGLAAVWSRLGQAFAPETAPALDWILVGEWSPG